MKITKRMLKKLIKEELTSIMKEQEPAPEEGGGMPDFGKLAQQGPQAVIAAVCGRLGEGGAEKLAAAANAFLQNPNADIAALLDKHLGEGHGVMANFLLKMKIEQAGGATLEQLLQPLRMAFAATRGFGGMIPGVKEQWAVMQKAALAATLPLIKAGCAAAKTVQPAKEPEEQAAAAPVQEHITKDLLKKMVKEELAR